MFIIIHVQQKSSLGASEDVPFKAGIEIRVDGLHLEHTQQGNAVA
jgi:hypothetical protein